MRPNNLTSTSRALYNVFILPTLSQPPPSLLRTPSRLKNPPHRTLTTTPPLNAKTRAPELRTEKWDEEITHPTLYIVDPATNRLPDRPQTRYDVLSRLDRTTHRLVQVGEAPLPADAFGSGGSIPVCKVVSKKEWFLESERKKAGAKERRKISALASSVKTLEINWAIDGHDLAHRLERMRAFLEEGRKVEVVLAAKKKGRKATERECEGVLRRIRGVVGEVQGAREEREMVGRLGAFTTLGFVGAPVVVRKEAG